MKSRKIKVKCCDLIRSIGYVTISLSLIFKLPFYCFMQTYYAQYFQMRFDCLHFLQYILCYVMSVFFLFIYIVDRLLASMLTFVKCHNNTNCCYGTLLIEIEGRTKFILELICIIYHYTVFDTYLVYFCNKISHYFNILNFFFSLKV